MNKKYKNPPVIEAVCAFRFSQKEPWDLTIPGLIYEKVRKDFPIKDQKKIIHDISIEQSEEGLQHSFRQKERIHFLTEDRKIFIQVGQNYLAVNCLKPYPGWENFEPKIEIGLNALEGIDTLKMDSLERVGLRYLNQIEIPSSTIKVEEYFQFRPSAGTKLSGRMMGFMVVADYPKNNDKEICRVRLAQIQPTENPENLCFMLDLDYFPIKPRTFTKEILLEWIAEAHNHIEESFEGCITDKCRELFGGVNE